MTPIRRWALVLVIAGLIAAAWAGWRRTAYVDHVRGEPVLMTAVSGGGAVVMYQLGETVLLERWDPLNASSPAWDEWHTFSGFPLTWHEDAVQVFGDLVVSTWVLDEGGVVRAVSATDGSLRWEVPFTGDATTATVHLSEDDGWVAWLDADGPVVQAFDATTGQERWSRRLDGAEATMHVRRLAATGDAVFATTLDGTWALDPADGAAEYLDSTPWATHVGAYRFCVLTRFRRQHRLECWDPARRAFVRALDKIALPDDAWPDACALDDENVLCLVRTADGSDLIALSRGDGTPVWDVPWSGGMQPALLWVDHDSPVHLAPGAVIPMLTTREVWREGTDGETVDEWAFTLVDRATGDVRWESGTVRGSRPRAWTGPRHTVALLNPEAADGPITLVIDRESALVHALVATADGRPFEPVPRRAEPWRMTEDALYAGNGRVRWKIDLDTCHVRESTMPGLAVRCATADELVAWLGAPPRLSPSDPSVRIAPSPARSAERRLVFEARALEGVEGAGMVWTRHEPDEAHAALAGALAWGDVARQHADAGDVRFAEEAVARGLQTLGITDLQDLTVDTLDMALRDAAVTLDVEME